MQFDTTPTQSQPRSQNGLFVVSYNYLIREVVETDRNHPSTEKLGTSFCTLLLTIRKMVGDFHFPYCASGK